MLWCNSPLKQVPAIVDCLMMTLLHLPHRQRGDYILYWCFAEIFAVVADCDEGRRVQFVSNTTDEVPGTIERQLLSLADYVGCTILHRLVLEVAEGWCRGRNTGFGVVVFCVQRMSIHNRWHKELRRSWNLAAKTSAHGHLC